MENRFKIDRRPIPLLFLIEYRNAFMLLTILGTFFYYINRDIPVNELPLPGYRAMIIFFLAVTLWTLNIIPVVITSLLIMGLLSVYNVLDSKTIYSFFGNSSVFFILGSFIISAGVKVSGLSKRIAFAVLSRYGNTPFKLVISIFLLSATMSHIMPEHAVAALMLPIVGDINKSFDKKTIFNQYMYFSIFWGCVLGGVVTYLGGARNPLAAGILNEMTGMNISFTRWWLGASTPIYVIISLIIFHFKRKIASETESGRIPKAFENRSNYRLKKITFNEIKAASILILTIFLWIFYNEELGISNIALLSASLYFVLNVAKWDEINREINWGVLFMYGGSIAIGSALNSVGVLKWFVDNYLINLNLSKDGFIILLIIISIFMTELISNTAVIVILLPVAINLGTKLGISPSLVTMGVALPSGLSYVFPISSPVVAMIYSTEQLELKRLLKSGFILKIISIVVIYIFIKFYFPFVGI
ncbi:DASS family sodium-coupled anion symporter [uncultured Ilyobacter sp.]|uniref:SLC13 family permease n=1 Tax=uncultured Ilyobacter sp. TaxID=544433 RepID=UPI0029F55B28|nr:DASS family sodium-coupled anion symporter [uncultured Ilyobacter sp.]